MKVLSLTQPYATLMDLDLKRIETRSWATRYRGPLAIHAAKGFPRWARELTYQKPFCTVLLQHDLRLVDLPLGAILCVVEVVDCVSTDTPDLDAVLRYRGAEHERAFGDYASGRFMWITEHLRRLPDPIQARGSLGLWDYDGVLL